jgi:hypothetical protein
MAIVVERLGCDPHRVKSPASEARYVAMVRSTERPVVEPLATKSLYTPSSRISTPAEARTFDPVRSVDTGEDRRIAAVPGGRCC